LKSAEFLKRAGEFLKSARFKSAKYWVMLRDPQRSSSSWCWRLTRAARRTTKEKKHVFT